MNEAKRKITLKVFFSYLALALLVVVVGWIIYGELNSFTKAQIDDTKEKNKILRIGKLLTLMYESESFARVAIQSTDPKPYANYLKKNDSISLEIEAIKSLVESSSQTSLLDSVQILLDQKIKNISDLREVRINDTSQELIKKAINRLANMESTLGRLTVNDFIENPANLNYKNRKNLEETITILNGYIPRDSTNTVNQTTLDSIVVASRTILQKIEEEASRQRFSLRVKERQLLKNDLIATQQLRTILSNIETEFLNNSSQKTLQRKMVLKRSINIVTIAAIIGLVFVIIFSLVILNDFWKNQRYREQIEKANTYTKSLLNSREQLISMVSHDLRSPLSTIVGYTELMQKIPQNSKGSYYIERIKSAATFVTQLVDDLLDYNKLEAGKIHIESIPFNLEKLVNETAENIKSIYKEKPIILQISVHNTLPTLLIGDPFRIRQIVSNLIGNAFKFTEEGFIKVNIKLKTNQAGKSFVHIEIKDTGVGIPKEKQQLIFEEFTQADTSIEKKHGGFGLGLTISKKLAHLLNGRLSLESKEGKGSLFSFIFPVTFCEKQQLNTHKEFSPNQKELTAIVIDDDEILIELTKEILNQNGIQAFTFDSAKAALNKIPNLKYDFIITDIQLPSMNGFHFTEKLQSNPIFNYQQQPIIAVSGRKNLKKKDYQEAGFAAFIIKPFLPEHLMTEIHSCLRIHKGVKLYTSKDCTDLNQAFNLNSLKSFLDNDQNVLDELLETFIQSTQKNLEEISLYIEDKNLIGLQKISHKMLTMFRQIEASEVLPHLAYFEFIKVFDAKEIEFHYQELKSAIHFIFEQIQTKQYY
ncbi:hybrid sensor histidine kinase/response regulator [Ascidiimonas sp. W6]|uniref:ATP-binding response regulator n=1 Tax=Ascidiimonas meishanensis TaxID=3128903 RepID=UPI0030EF0257